MVKVSIIMPVYNTAPYLRNSVGSVLGQTLADLELIAVDNGSTDGSGKILEEIAACDNRLKIFDMPRKGVSAARNEGLKHVNGKYMYFLDSDDELLPNTLAICLDECEKENLDFITFDAQKQIVGNDCMTVQDYDRSWAKMEGKVWNGTDLLDSQMSNGTYRGSLWLMFCRTDFVFSFFKTFAEGFIHEDQLFVVSSYLHAQRVEYLPLKLYRRNVHSDSIMTRRFSMRNVNGYRRAIKDVGNIKGHKDIIGKWKTMTVNAVAWQCHNLSWVDKLKALFVFILPNIKDITFRNLCVFLLKSPRKES